MYSRGNACIVAIVAMNIDLQNLNS